MQKEKYIGLKATKTLHLVTEEEVTGYLEKIRQANAKTLVITDRAAQDGDEVILDYAGFVGEEQFAGGTAENQSLTLGSGTFIPGFEEQLVGAQLEQQVDVHVTFPEVYHSADLAGKEAVFKCTIHAIHQKTPYEMDDEFAQNIAGLPTLAEMRAVLREQMQSAAEEQAYNQLVDQLMLALAQNCGDIAVDPEAVEREIDNMLAGMEQQLRQQGLGLEQYLQFTGRSMEELRTAQRDQAEFGARVTAALDEIADDEGIEALEEDYEREFELIAAQCGVPAQQVKNFFDAESLKAMGREIRQKKAVSVVLNAAEVETIEE